MLEWTEGQVETLKTMWGEGSSAAEIARALGPDATRNAVIGKITRMKLERRATTKVRAAAAVGRKGSADVHRGTVDGARKAREVSRNGNAGVPKAAAISHRMEIMRRTPPKALAVPTDLPDVTRRIGLVELGDDECRWCSGDPLTADHSFCGKQVRPGTSWCDEHYSRVFSDPRS